MFNKNINNETHDFLNVKGFDCSDKHLQNIGQGSKELRRIELDAYVVSAL